VTRPSETQSATGELDAPAGVSAEPKTPSSGGRRSGGSFSGTRWLFTATTFLSAFLLFSIQPMFAKMVLPLLGGAPSVWAVALLFFQGALLVGYAYAHLLVRTVAAAASGFVHLALSLAAFLALPIAIPAGWAEPPPGDAYLWQLGLFAVAIGVPFVAVSANAPLLQAWYARTGNRDSADPYFLYAASNLGSLVALLGYPFVFEPAFGLCTLATFWTFGFAALVLALAACFAVIRKAEGASASTVAAASGEVLGWRRRAAWVGLAFVPSALLTAFTTHVATDVASAPLIWVIPLALFLLTFVVVFRERALIPRPVLLALHAVATILALLQLAQTEKETWFYSAGFGAAAFITATLVAHRTLYEARPSAARLTEFYLWMSAGGVLGGLFAALIAPKIFSEVFEYPLLLALSFACRPDALDLSRESRKSLALFGVLILVAGALIAWGPDVAYYYQLGFGGWGATAGIAAGFAILALILWRHPPHVLLMAIALYLTVTLLPSGVHRGQAQRSYFGVYRVVQSADGHFNVLQHGTTLHGAQRIRDVYGNPIASTTPATYYHPRGPMATAVRIAGRLAAMQARELTVGVIGLGAGSMACHSASGEHWRFFEIDPVMVGIAKSKNFTFLVNCQPNADIVIGDARLTFAKEEAGRYDLLIVDAFSSDAIPMHLLTAEAIRLYASKMKPDGVVVLHISNRYLDLEQVLAATLPAAGGLHGLVVEDPEDDGYEITGSTVVVVAKSWEAIDPYKGMIGARNLPQPNLKPWTDDSSDVLGPFLSQYRKRH
jgi:hypothetical protein